MSLYAQVNNEFETTVFNEIVAYSAKDFDFWLKPKLQNRLLGQKPLFESALVLSRLKSDRFTTDDAVKSILDAWIASDWKTIRRRDVTIYDIEELGSVTYIDSVLTLLYKRPLLEIKLRRARQDLINQNFGSGYSNPLSNYDKLVSLSNDSREYLIVTYYKSCNELASVYLKDGNVKDAEKYFSKPLSYPFYIEDDELLKNELFDLYVSAGKGILKCRSNNLKMLKHTFFTPAARIILDPIRDEIIAELEKKK